jgi:hypothetical protein
VANDSKRSEESTSDRPTPGADAARTSAAATSDQRAAKQADGEGKEARRRPQVSKEQVKKGSDAVRSRVASAVWLVAVLAALVLAVGALLVALGANRDNSIVDLVLDTGHQIDGPFWKVFEFTKESRNGTVVVDQTKEYLVNWGLAAVGYLVVGRILDRVIRP